MLDLDTGSILKSSSRSRSPPNELAGSRHVPPYTHPLRVLTHLVLQMKSGRVISRADLISSLTAAHVPPEQLLALQPLPNSTDEVLQVVVQVGDLLRSFKAGISDAHLRLFRAQDKQRSRDAAATWDLFLQRTIEVGQPEVLEARV